MKARLLSHYMREDKTERSCEEPARQERIQGRAVNGHQPVYEGYQPERSAGNDKMPPPPTGGSGVPPKPGTLTSSKG